jgi:hypothetical protein
MKKVHPETSHSITVSGLTMDLETAKMDIVSLLNLSIMIKNMYSTWYVLFYLP